MKSKKRATLQEFADYFEVHRDTIRVWKNKYNAAFKNKYNPKSIDSVFDFFKYLLEEKI